MTGKNTLIIAVLILLALISILLGVKALRDKQEHMQEIAAYNPLIPLINIQNEDDFITIADKTRIFINKNSIHNIDEEFKSHWGKHDIISKKMQMFAMGQSQEPVHLECSSRAAVMEKTLQNIGYRTRSVDVYSHTPEFRAHSFLEILDPETGKWTVQDPGYNIFWVINQTGERASIIDMISHGAEGITPCHTQNLCGWDIQGFGGQDSPQTLKPFLGLAVIIDRHENTRELYYNPEIFPLEEPQVIAGKGTMPYCTYRPKNCQAKIVNLKATQ